MSVSCAIAVTEPPAGTHGPAAVTVGGWNNGIVCHESGKNLTFQFGVDYFIYCSWYLADTAMYQFATAVMKQEAGWNCRVPMSKDRSFYLPVVIPLWGIVEVSSRKPLMHEC